MDSPQELLEHDKLGGIVAPARIAVEAWDPSKGRGDGARVRESARAPVIPQASVARSDALRLPAAQGLPLPHSGSLFSDHAGFAVQVRHLWSWEEPGLAGLVGPNQTETEREGCAHFPGGGDAAFSGSRDPEPSP